VGAAASSGFRYFWMSDSCPQTVRDLEGKAPFEVLTLAEPIAAALQIWGWLLWPGVADQTRALLVCQARSAEMVPLQGRKRMTKWAWARPPWCRHV